MGLSKATKFTKRQTEFIKAIGKPDSKFTLRNTKFVKEFELEQGIELKIKTYIKTSTNGNPEILNNLDIIKIK